MTGAALVETRGRVSGPWASRPRDWRYCGVSCRRHGGPEQRQDW